MTLTVNISFKEIQELTDKYIVGTYNRYPVAFRYGVGETLYDTNNKSYIDFQCGISVTNLGHGEADIIEMLRNQSDRLFHTSNLYYSEEQAKLAETIVANAFPSKVFFCNSGTEAIEAAFKLMRKHATDRGIASPVVLALSSSFHGRSAAGMSMTGNSSIREGFGDLLPDVHFVKENNEDSLIAAFDQYGDRLAGIIMEPIIGEGGIIPLSQEFVNMARKLTTETNSLLIFDEIQTGMGRTGKMFCFEHFGFRPDAFTLAKALGSGFPIGALVVAEEFANVLSKGVHGSTFGGNHLACAIAFETFRVILSRDLLDHTVNVSQYAMERLKSIQKSNPIIKEVRGRGLHIGVVLTQASRPVAEACLRNGLVINATANNVIRVMPPINISQEKMEEGLTILENTLKEFK
jgi:acetylornithine/N-succinyldiaminopimelate aminotransferase